MVFFKGIGFIVLLVTGVTFVTGISLDAGVVLAVAIVAVFGIGSLIRLPKLRLMPGLYLGHRGFSFAIFLFVGLPFLIFVGGLLQERDESELAILKSSNKQAYLERLRDHDHDRWLEELSALDPKQFTLVKEQIAAEEAAKAAEERARKCDDELDAYWDTKRHVKEMLQAPATANFPWSSEVVFEKTGECEFRVRGYVDYKNLYGVPLRSRYSATMVFVPAKDFWFPLEIEIF